MTKVNIGMKTIALYIIRKWLSPKKVAELLAKVIANLLRKASKTGKWDLFKVIVQKVEKACHLFNECYEDDNMDKDDEEKIANAIEHITDGIDFDRLIKEAK